MTDTETPPPTLEERIAALDARLAALAEASETYFTMSQASWTQVTTIVAAFQEAVSIIVAAVLDTRNGLAEHRDWTAQTLGAREAAINASLATAAAAIAGLGQRIDALTAQLASMAIQYDQTTLGAAIQRLTQLEADTRVNRLTLEAILGTLVQMTTAPAPPAEEPPAEEPAP